MSWQPSDFRIALGDARVVLRENVVLAPMTHIRIGGPAALLAEPYNEEAAAAVMRTCHELSVPLFVLGGGSNLVVDDRGWPGVVMVLSSLNGLVRDGTTLAAGAGVSLPSLLRASREIGLAGLEVLCGIPAVVGGAVAMNAGTRDGESFDRLASVTLVDAQGEIVERPVAELSPSYRDGGLGGAIVLQAAFDLYEDDPKRIFARFEDSLRKRNATQPVSEKSVGCVFKNPETGPAGRLIEEAGCKLLRRGAVRVSAKHANYFVNEGGGTCEDFLELMAAVQERVEERSGVKLMPEVKLVGVERG